MDLHLFTFVLETNPVDHCPLPFLSWTAVTTRRERQYRNVSEPLIADKLLCSGPVRLITLRISYTMSSTFL